jgi:hypothetical protein
MGDRKSPKWKFHQPSMSARHKSATLRDSSEWSGVLAIVGIIALVGIVLAVVVVVIILTLRE